MNHSQSFYEELNEKIAFHRDRIKHHEDQLNACLVLLNDNEISKTTKINNIEVFFESKSTNSPALSFPISATKETQAITLMRDFTNKKALTLFEVQNIYSKLNPKRGDITASVRLAKKHGVVNIKYSHSFVLWGFIDMLNEKKTDFKPECIPAHHWEKILDIRTAENSANNPH